MTAYELRISDWSSDVCSSDLVDGILTIDAGDQIDIRHDAREGDGPTLRASGSLTATANTSISGEPGSLIAAGGALSLTTPGAIGAIGRASCRESRGQYL